MFETASFALSLKTAVLKNNLCSQEDIQLSIVSKVQNAVSAEYGVRASGMLVLGEAY
jgi:hypothetical protein